MSEEDLLINYIGAIDMDHDNAWIEKGIINRGDITIDYDVIDMGWKSGKFRVRCLYDPSIFIIIDPNRFSSNPLVNAAFKKSELIELRDFIDSILTDSSIPKKLTLDDLVKQVNILNINLSDSTFLATTKQKVIDKMKEKKLKFEQMIDRMKRGED